jgi:hypothetical protein
LVQQIPVIKDAPVGQNLQDHYGILAMQFLAPRGKGFHYKEEQAEFLKYVESGKGIYIHAVRYENQGLSR